MDSDTPIPPESETDGSRAPAQDTLVEEILAATTTACAECADHLVGWTEGTLGDATRMLVAQHLETCVRCEHLVATLHHVDHVLAGMQDVQPPSPELVEAILEETLGTPESRWQILLRRARGVVHRDLCDCRAAGTCTDHRPVARRRIGQRRRG